MTDKKNTPSDTNGESKEKETLDSLAIAAFKDQIKRIKFEPIQSRDKILDRIKIEP